MRNRTASAPAPARRAPAGLALIEIVLAAGMLSLLVLGALAFYSAILKNKNLVQAVAEVTAIRTAVRLAEGGSDERAISWDDLAPYLPARLRSLADGDQDTTLDGANPWGGDYTYSNVAGNEGAWILDIDMPADLRGMLLQRLRRADPTIGVTTPGIPPLCCDRLVNILSCTSTVSGTTCAQHLVGNPPGWLVQCTDTDRGASIHVPDCSTYHINRAQRLQVLDRTTVFGFDDKPDE